MLFRSEEFQTLFNQERLDKMYQSNLPALIENQFNSLLHLSTITESDLNRFKVFNIDLSVGIFLLGIIEIDHDADFSKIEQLRIFLLNVLKEKFSDCLDMHYFNTGYGLVFIINDQEIDMEEVESCLYEIVLTKKEFSDIKIKIGVSDVFDDFKNFTKYINQAKKALSYSNYLNMGTVIYYKDISSKKSMHLQLSREEINEISHVIKFGSEKEIHDLFNNLIKDNSLHQEYLLNKQYYIVNLTHIFIEFANSLHVEIQEMVEGDIVEKLSEYHHLSDMFSFLEKLVFDIREANIETSKTRANDILEEAVFYLNNNFADTNISMDSLCEKLGVSISYLSTMFKKVLETSFGKYLIGLRMEKAKELLRFSNKIGRASCRERV